MMVNRLYDYALWNHVTGSIMGIMFSVLVGYVLKFKSWMGVVLWLCVKGTMLSVLDGYEL
jgi:hypothetical protein